MYLLNGKSLSLTDIKMSVTFPTAIRWTNSAISVASNTPLERQDTQLQDGVFGKSRINALDHLGSVECEKYEKRD